MKIPMLLKEVKTKSLVSGDKSVRVLLESLRPEDINHLASLSDLTLVEVEITPQSDLKRFYVEEDGEIKEDV